MKKYQQKEDRNKQKGERGINSFWWPSSAQPTGRLFANPTRVSRGFTLVEIIVSLAIFSVVATVALGALIKIVDANRKAQTLHSAITNLNFALESMSREMRVGTKYHCDSGTNVNILGNTITATQPCPGGSINEIGTGGGGYIAFNSSKRDVSDPDAPCNLIIVYRFFPTPGGGFSIEKAQQPGCEDSIPGSLFSPIIDPTVFVTSYYLRVVDDTYPLGTMRVSGYAGTKERDKTYFDVQTAISSRVP